MYKIHHKRLNIATFDTLQFFISRISTLSVVSNIEAACSDYLVGRVS